MKAARRLDSLPMYVFATLGERLKTLQAQGLDVIRLDIGSPDGPPPNFVVGALARSAADPSHHSYAGYLGTAALREALADYYSSRFGVRLDSATEVLPLLGSKEGIANISQAWLDPGDLVLVPDPGYPTYRAGALMAGAAVHNLPLLEANDYLPDLGAIPERVAEKARMMWLNYPNNPTGAVAALGFLESAVAYCRRFEILLCHDAPYADVSYNGYEAPSVLQVPGAKDVAVEFNSLSKSHNMAGWRVGVAAGNRTALRALLKVKTNIDTGIFLPIQDAAVAALNGDQTWISERNREYCERRDILHAVLALHLGLRVAKPAAGLYLWPHVPEGYSSQDFTEHVLMSTGVSLTSGAEFGPHGEGYVRVSLGQSTPRIHEAARRLRTLRI